MTNSFDQSLKEQLQTLLDSSTEHIRDDLEASLRLLTKWRCALIQNTLIQHNGYKVLSGPMQGMEFLPTSAEGCHIPKLLGCYEEPLHPYLEAIIALDYPIILNIGCAEGYYAVGLARRMPNTVIHAYDLDENARITCQALAEKNGVQDRITIGSLFTPQDFEYYSGQRVLLLCDIEGAERDLLDPIIAPVLARMDIIVESHECLIPGITKLLVERFSASHQITCVIDNGPRLLPHPPQWFSTLSHLDQLLAVWEWRSGQTPWLLMKAK